MAESAAQRQSQQEITPHGARKGTYCLLVHGFNGEPADLRDLANVLRAEGMIPRRLLLPGHGTNIYDFAAHGWDDWFQAVRRATTEALAHYDKVFLIGHSLGAALVLSVASVEPEVAGVVALCPPVRLREPIQQMVKRVRGILPAIPTGIEDVYDRRGARSLYRRNVYPWTPLAAVDSLFAALPTVRAMLPAVKCPALIVRALHDHVVPARDGLEAYELIGSKHKELITLERSFHAVTKDIERHIVFAETVRFCHEAIGEHDLHDQFLRI